MSTVELGPIMPSYAVIAWAGTVEGNFDEGGMGVEAMKGWAICNGKNGTPDLCHRFIRGETTQTQSDYPCGGGSVVLRAENIPEITGGEHGHGIEVSSLGQYPTGINGPGSIQQNATFDVSAAQLCSNKADEGDDYGMWTGIFGITALSNSVTLGSTKPTPVNVVPPYTDLIYLMKLPG